MNLLLDTHTLLWLRGEPARLRPETTRILIDPANSVFVSVVSLWEIALKCRIGKLRVDIAAIIGGMAPSSKLQWLAIKSDHLLELSRLPHFDAHRDPFDHLIIAQAISEGMTLISSDRKASLYEVQITAA